MRLDRNQCLCVAIDLQSSILAHMDESERVLHQSSVLLKGMRILGIPIMVTEQCPKGLGPTAKEIQDILGERQRYLPKRAFGVLDDDQFAHLLHETGKHTLVLLGIEAHICLLQSVVDLQEKGYQCVVVADAISSRGKKDAEVALLRMQKEGAILTTTESVLFELLKTSTIPEFKEISKLIK